MKITFLFWRGGGNEEFLFLQFTLCMAVNCGKTFFRRAIYQTNIHFCLNSEWVVWSTLLVKLNWFKKKKGKKKIYCNIILRTVIVSISKVNIKSIVLGKQTNNSDKNIQYTILIQYTFNLISNSSLPDDAHLSIM